jgi:hypothetical protein
VNVVPKKEAIMTAVQASSECATENVSAAARRSAQGLHHITARLPGRVSGETTFTSAGDLEYIVPEQAGKDLPS